MPKRNSRRSNGSKSSKTSNSRDPLRLQIPGSIKSISNQTYTIVQHLEIPDYHVTSITLPTFAATGVTFNAFDQYAALTAIFDQYRIAELEFRYCPRININDGSFGVNFGTFHSVVDVDDANNLTTVNSALDFPTCKMWTPGSNPKNLVQHFCPRIAMSAWSGAFTSYANMNADVWIDTGSPAVAYFGAKTAASVSSIVMHFDLYITAKLQFRNVR
jgi:hypothetical protein